MAAFSTSYGWYHPRKLASFMSACLVLALAACGGDGPIMQAPPSPQPELDFSAIQGAWSGWAVSPSGTVQWGVMTLSDGTPVQGDLVGRLETGTLEEGELVLQCIDDLFASEAGPPEYLVVNLARADSPAGDGCVPSGETRMEHDPDAETLHVEFTGTGEAAGFSLVTTLTPGVDPGPPPSP